MNHILGGPGKGLQQLRLRYMSLSASRTVGTSSLPAGKAHFKCLWLFAPWSPVIIFSFLSELLSRCFGSADVSGCSSHWSRRCFSVGRGWIFREVEQLMYISVSQSLCSALQRRVSSLGFFEQTQRFVPGTSLTVWGPTRYWVTQKLEV